MLIPEGLLGAGSRPSENAPYACCRLGLDQDAAMDAAGIGRDSQGQLPPLIPELRPCTLLK